MQDTSFMQKSPRMLPNCPVHHCHHYGPSRMDRLESDEDVRAEFSCPYCYEEFDAKTLWVHLEVEHCFDSKVATCPICSTRIVEDMVGHIAQQHGQYFKIHRRRKFKRAGFPSNATLSLLGKELREAHLEVLIGGTSRTRGIISNTTDPLISSIVYNVPLTDATDVPKPGGVIIEETLLKQASTLQQLKPILEISLTMEERKEQQREAELRANFVQELVLSSLASTKKAE